MSSKSKRRVTVETGNTVAEDSEKRKPSVFERLGPGAGPQRIERKYSDYDNAEKKCRPFLLNGECPFGATCKYKHVQLSRKSKTRDDDLSPENLRLKLKSGPSERSGDKQRDSDSESHDPQGRASGRSRRDKEGESRDRSQSHTRRDKETKLKSQVVVKKAGGNQDSDESGDDSESNWLNSLDYKKELELEQERQQLQRELSQLAEEEVPPPQSGSDSSPDRGRSGKPLTSPHDKRSTSPSGRGKKDKKHQTKSPPAADAREKKVSPQPPLDKARDHKKRHEAEEDSHKKHKKKKDKDKRRPPSPSPADLKAKRRDKEDADAGPSRSLQPSKRSRSSSSDSSASPPRSKDSKDKVGKVKGRKKKGRGGGGGKGDGGSGSDEAPTSKSKKWLSPLKKTLKLKKVKPASSVSDLKDEEERSKRSTSPSRRGADSRDLLAEDPMPPSRSSHDAKRADAHHDLIGKRDWDSSRARSSEKRDKKHKGKRSESPAVSGSVDRAGGSSSRRGSRTREAPFERSKGPSSRRPSHSPPPPSAPPGSSDRDRDRDRSGKRGEGRGGGGGGGGDAPYDRNNRKWEQERERGGERDRKGGGGGGDDRPKRGDRGGGSPPQGGSKPSGELYSPSQLDRDTPGPGDIPGPRGSGHARGDSSRGDDDRRGGGQNRDGRRGGGGEGRGGERGERAVGGDKGPPPSSRTQTPPKPDRYGRRGGDAEGFDGPYGGQGQDRGRGLDPERNRGGSDAREGRGEGRGGGPGEVGDREGRGRRGADGFERGGGALPQQRDRSRGGEGPGGGGREGPGGGREGPGGVRGEPGFDRPEPGRSAGGRDASRDARDNEGRDRSRDGPRDRGDNLRGGDGPRDREGRPPLGDGAKFGNSSFGAEGPRRGGQWDAGNRSGDWGPDRPDPPRDLGGGRLDERGRGAFRDDGREPGGRGGERRGGGGGRDMPGGGRDMPGGEGGVGGGPRLDRDGPRLDRSLDGGRPDREGPRLDRDGPRLDRERPDNNNPRGGERGGGERGGDGRMDRGGPDRMGPGDRLDRGGGDRSLERGEGGRMDRGDNRAGDRGDRVDRGDVRLDRGDGRMDRGGGGDRMDRGGPGREPPGGGIGPGGLDQRGGGARPGGRGGAADGRGGMRGGVMDNNNRGGGGGGGGGGPMDARGLEFERGRPGERGGNLRGGDGPGDLVGRGGVGGMRGGPDRGPDRDGRLLDRERDRERELQGMGLTMPPLGPRDRFEPPLPPDFRRGDDRGGPLPFRDDLLLPPPDAVLLRGGVGGGDRRGGGGMVVDDRFAEGPRGGGDPRGDPQQRGGHRGFDDGHMRDERILGRLPMDDRQVRGGGGGGGGGERMLPQRRGGGGGGGGGRDGGGIHPVPFEFDRPPGPQDVRGQDLLPGGGRRVPLLPTPMDELPPPRGRGGGREEFDGRDGPPGPGGRDLPRDLREERGGGGGRRGDQREGGPGFIPGVEMGGGGGRDDRVGGRRGDPRGDLEFPPPDLGPSPRGRDFPRDGPRDGPRDPFWERDGPNKDGRDNLGRGGGGDLPLRDASGRRLGGPRGGGGVPGDDMVPLDILDRGRDVLDRSREVLDRSRERGGRPDLGPRRGDRDRSPRGVDADKRNQDKRGREEKREEGGGGGGDRGSGSGSRGRDSSRDNAKDASDARSTRSADDLRDPLPLRLKDKVAAADGPPTRASSLRGGKERDSQSDGKRSPSRNRGGAGSKDRSPLDVPDRARPGLKRTRSLSPKQRRPGNNNSNNRDAPPSPAGGPPDNNNTPTPNTTTTTASRPSPAKPPGGGGKRGEDLDPSPLAGRSRTPVGTKRKLDEEILRSPAAGGAPRGNKDEIKSPGAKRAREQSKSPGRKGSRQASPATSHHSGPIGGRDMLRGGRPGGAGGGVEARFFGAHPRDRGEGGGGPGSWRDRERESANVKSEKPSEDGKGDAEKGDGTRKRPRSPLRSQGRVPDNADKGRKRWRGENYHPALVRAFEAGVSFLELKTKLGEVQDKFRLIQLQSQTRNIVARKTVLDRRYDREHVLSESDDLLLVWDCRRRALLDWFIRKDRRAQLTHFQEDAQTCVNVWSPVKDVRYLPVAEMLAGRASIIASALRHFLDGTWSDTDRADSAEKDAFRQKLDQGRTADNAGNAGEAGGRQQDPSKGPPSSAFPPPSQSPLATEATKPNRPGGRPDSFGARGGAGGNEDHAHSAQDARFNRGADRNEGRTAEDISLRLNQNNTDDSKDPALTMLYNHEDDYEKISSDESDFEDEKQAQQNIVGLLDIDWASLAKEEETPKPHTGSLVRRLHPAAIFSRIGLSRALAGPALFNKVKALCQEGIKVQAATPEEGSEEEKKKEDAGSGGPAVDLSLRAEVPVLHMALVRQRRERSNLLRNLGPFRRALCARRDLEIRRQLCKVDKVYEQPAVFPAHVMDTDLQKLSMQLFRQGRDFVDRKDSECDSKIELSI